MLTRENYRGVFAYPPTPFKADLSLDGEALRANLRKLVNIGVDGVVLAGTSGEFYALDDSEYREIAAILSEETSGTGVLSVLSTTGLSTRHAIDRSRMAMTSGIDGVLLVQPFYSPLTDDELIRFWTDLCLACPDIGVLIYHYDWVRQTYTPDTYRRLAHLPNLVGSKEAHWEFDRWLTIYRQSPLRHMSSTDAGWLVELVRHGAIGVGSLQICYMPHVVARVLDLCAQERFHDAERALAPFTELIGRVKLGAGRPHIYPSDLPGWERLSGIARHKALVDAFGFLQVGPPRQPALPASAELQTSLRQFLRERYPDLIPPPGYGEPGSKPAGIAWPVAGELALSGSTATRRTA